VSRQAPPKSSPPADGRTLNSAEIIKSEAKVSPSADGGDFEGAETNELMNK